MVRAKLARYISELGIASNLSKFRTNFETRLELQKTIYLLEEAGAKLGYSFGWYKHGPYSSSLADDAYRLASLPQDALQHFQASFDHQALSKFRRLTEDVTVERPSVLELLASVHYVMTNSYPRARNKKTAVEAIMAVKGDRFSRQEIEKAYDKLRNAGYIRE